MQLEILSAYKIVSESIYDESIASASLIIQEYNSKNSKIAYESDMAYWSAWYDVNELRIEDGVRKEHIIMFIMQHAQDMPRNVHENLVLLKFKSQNKINHKISTIERRLSSLSRYLHLYKLSNPCNDKDITILLRKLTEKHGSSKSWGCAITLDILNDLLNTCSNDGLIGIRDSALLLFGFSTGGRRRSEISTALFENLTKNNDGTYIYNLGKSKTNQSGNVDPKPITGRAAIALTYWISTSKVSNGYLFRSIGKGNKNVTELGISDKQISRIIKSRCLKSNYDPKKFTAHSLRSGFVTESGKRGKNIGDVMALTGHRSTSTLMRYYQTGNILNNSAAYLVG